MKKNKYLVMCANLVERADRRAHVLNEFKARDEFKLVVVTAIRDIAPSVGIWATIKSIVSQDIVQTLPFFIFCEDDHTFTPNYELNHLKNAIVEAVKFNADIILGGVSSVRRPLQVSESLFLVESFTGLQFVVVFRKFYSLISKSEIIPGIATDHYLSLLSRRKFVIVPFISKQKEFGYSDVTANNNEKGFVDRLFVTTENKLQMLMFIHKFYLNKISKLEKKSTNVVLSQKSRFAIGNYLVVEYVDNDKVLYYEIGSVDKCDFKVSSFAFEVVLAFKIGCRVLVVETLSVESLVHINGPLFWINNYSGCRRLIVSEDIFSTIARNIHKIESLDSLIKYSNDKMYINIADHGNEHDAYLKYARRLFDQR